MSMEKFLLELNTYKNSISMWNKNSLLLTNYETHKTGHFPFIHIFMGFRAESIAQLYLLDKLLWPTYL